MWKVRTKKKEKRMNLMLFLLFLLCLLPHSAFHATRRSREASCRSSIGLLMDNSKRELLRDELINLCDKSQDNSVNRGQIVGLIEELSSLYPCTSKPLYNWKYRIDNDQSEVGSYKPPSQYDGIWDTRYTTIDTQVSARSRQMVNSTSSEVKYVIEGWQGKSFKIVGCDVTYKLQALSDNKYKLFAKQITLYRKSRIGLNNIGIPFFIDFILKRLRHKTESTLEIVYMDEEMCVEQNENREYYIKTRLYEAWNPLNPKGWELISCL